MLDLKIVSSLRLTPPASEWSKLFAHLIDITGRKDLASYEMVTELQLYINAKDYMVADIVLFKRDAITTEVLDVILIENKLSSTTKFTPRQAEMFRKVQDAKRLEVKVRSRRKGAIKRDEIIPLSSSQLVEIRGDGKTTGVEKVTLGIIK